MKFTAQNIFGKNHPENLAIEDIGIESNYDMIVKAEAAVLLLKGESVAGHVTKELITLQVGATASKWVVKKLFAKKFPRTVKAFNVVTDISAALSMAKAMRVANEALNILVKTEKEALQAK